MPLITGLVLAIAGGGGGFYAVQSGLLPVGGLISGAPHAAAPGGTAGPAELGAGHGGDTSGIAFVEMDPIVISLRKGGGPKHLQFRAQLETAAGHEDEVRKLLPRVVDVLNTYLRALEVQDLADPMALPRLRAQMLRRINVATGPGRVRDLLIMDFILN